MDSLSEAAPTSRELHNRADSHSETPLGRRPAPGLDPEAPDVGTREGAVEPTEPLHDESRIEGEALSADSPSEATAAGPNELAQEGRPQNLPSREDLRAIAARLIVFGFTGKGPTLNKHAKNMIAQGEMAACQP